MKSMKKWISGLITSVATALVAITCVFAPVTASAATYTPEFDVCEETSPFRAVRILGQKEKINAQPGHYVNGEYIWAVAGNPSPQVNLNFAVSVNDWSNATEMRIRFKSNGLESANTNSGDNNIAVGFGGWNDSNSGIFRKITKPFGNAKFTDANEKSVSGLYYVNSNIPYFNVGRWQNCYVQIPLDAESFQDVAPSENNIFKLGPVSGSEDKLDMTRIEFVYIKLEPMNYNAMCFDFGDIEIKINGEWVKVFDSTQGSIATKKSNNRNTILALQDNQWFLDPHYDETVGTTTDGYQLSVIEATPCVIHTDANVDSRCDLCLGPVPHYNYDLFGDGECDDCGKSICGDGVCVDETGDGGCDVCYHRDYVAQPEPPVDDEPETPIGPSVPPAGGNEGKKDGCGSVIGVAPFAVVTFATALVCVFKKKED